MASAAAISNAAGVLAVGDDMGLSLDAASYICSSALFTSTNHVLHFVLSILVAIQTESCCGIARHVGQLLV